MHREIDPSQFSRFRSGRLLLTLGTAVAAMVFGPNGVQGQPLPLRTPRSALRASASARYALSKPLRSRCLQILRAGFRSDEFWPSIHAAEALTLSGHPDEVRALLEPKLKTERDDQKRCGLARELVRAGDRSKANIMLGILASKNPYGHVHAAESLYKVFAIGDGRIMRRAFARADNVRLKLMTAAALGRCGNSQVMTFLRETLDDADPETSRTVAWILGRIGGASDIPRLRKSAAAAKDPFTRCYSEHALAALGDAAGLRALRDNLAADDPAIRTYAATFAGDAHAVSVGDDLVLLLDHENIDVRVRAAQSLFVLSQPAPPSPDDHITSIVYEATKQNPRYTEGSILELRDGSLLFAVTQFMGGGSDFSKARIVARRSRDGGRTWNAPRVLQENSGDLNVMSATLRRLRGGRPSVGRVVGSGDPPTTGDRATTGDRIALFYLEKNGFDNLQAYVRFSDDDAKTFGEPVRVTTEAGYHVVNNDRVTQLSSGRLLVPVAATKDVRKVNHFVSYCYLSDDGGKSWRKGRGVVDLPKRGAMEPEVVELNDGRLLMIVRTQLGYIAKSYSTDGGDTWSKPQTLGVQAPEAPASLRRIPATGDLLLIWNNTYKAGAGHGGKRTPLTAAVSTDEGKTWKHIRNLETNPGKTYAYTSIAFAKDRAILSYWESGPQPGRLSARFRSLPVSWFYTDKK